MSDKPNIVSSEREAEAFLALEEAFAAFMVARSETEYEFRKNGVTATADNYLAARRAAREAGYVPVMIHQDTIEELRFIRDEHPTTWALFDDMKTGPGIKAFRMVVRDLMSVVMGDKP